VEGSSEKRQREIILKTLADHGWQLAEDQEQFAVEICAEICQRGIADTTQERTAIQRAVMRHYCVILHAACAESNTSRQRRAFVELWNYLFPIALYKTHDAALAQDLAQQSLEKIWKHWVQCKDPASFLGYVRMVLINEIRDWFRKNNRATLEPIDEIVEIGTNPVSVQSGTEAERAENDDLRRQLLDVIEKCLKDPRQRAIIIESFLNECGYKEIAEMLDITVGNVHVLRHRALQTLRKCQVFIESLGDYFK
jgi:RNA polymerase sigma-70 factor (ECF subfamily)